MTGTSGRTAAYLAVASTIAAMILVGMWIRSASMSVAFRAQADALEADIAQVRASRDSVGELLDLASDSVQALTEDIERTRERDAAAAIRLRMARGDADEAVRPDFAYAGTDTVLASRADSLLYSRLLATGDTARRTIRPVSGGHLVPRELLVDYVRVHTVTLPSMRALGEEYRHAISVKDRLISEQGKKIALQSRQLVRWTEIEGLYVDEIGDRERLQDLYANEIARRTWWMRGAVAAGIGVVLVSVL